MTIPEVPEQLPGQTPIILPTIANPYLGVWWSTQTVSNVPENVMGWLVAQGYEVTGITQDTTTVPPTNYFALTREGMKPVQVLLSLCNSYTIAANEARDANQARYNEVLVNWTEMIDTTHDHFAAQITEQNTQAGVFMTDLDGYMDAIETLISSNQTQMVADAGEAKTALTAMDLRLSDLESNAAATAVDIEALLTDQETTLQAYITDYNARLAELQANVVAHISAVQAEVTALETVTDDHVTAYADAVDLLLVNYNAHVVDIDALLASVATNLSTYVTEVGTILTELDADYTAVSTDLDAVSTSAGALVDAHVTDFQSVLALLTSDYTTHATTIRSVINFLLPDFTSHATDTRDITTLLLNDYDSHEFASGGLLDGLGTTELARINEEFAARLSVQLQQLVTRGLSTATLITDITERNHRDRDEQIQLLNDRLNRERFESQHKLYEQKRGVRTQALDNEHRLYDQQRTVRSLTIEGESRLYEQQLNMRTRSLDGKNQLHAVRQEVLRYQASLISGVYAILQETRNRVLAGKQAIFSAKDASNRLGIEVQSRLYAQLQDVQQRNIDSTDRIYQIRDAYAKWSNAETHKLYEQLQQVKLQFMEAVERKHSASQTVIRTEISQRDILLQQLQTALNGLLGGKERFSSLLLQNANALADHKHRAIAERMNTAVARLDGWKSVAADNRALMAYQLDERNKLLIGLYSFVERRDDVGPEWKDQAAMIASLGDSGGGWITP
jgi:hypothetical protein